MHIKKLVVCGFKSYKEKVEVDDLHEGVNIVVGRNGSGKSNLFAAIEFALTLEYRFLRSTDRSALLYQGQQLQDPAYVEIVFDNKDKKLPVEGDTEIVTFRRVLATKKDKFFVNGKELSNARQFLDVAGFTNPYFIVKQGKVNQLAVGNDEARLKLLQDVAGSSDYENKIDNFKRCLRDGESKRMEIRQTLNRLLEKKTLLEKEATELQEFLKVDKICRAIEYVIHGREEKAVSAQVATCSEQRKQLAEQQGPFKIQLARVAQECEEIENEISTLRQSIRTNEDRKEATQNEVLGLVSEIEKLKIQRDDLEKQVDSELSPLSEQIKNLGAEYQDQEDFIAQKNSQLTKIRKKENKIFTEFVKMEADLKEIENNFLQTKDKKGLSEELRMVQGKLKKDSKREDELKIEIETQRKSLSEIKLKLQQKESLLDEVRAELKRLEYSEDLPNKSIDEWKRAQSDMWRELNETDHNLHKVNENHAYVVDQFRKRAGRSIMDGWESVKQVLQTFEGRGDKKHVLEGYYGLVIENIDNEAMVDRAVESAVGRKLYHHIVEDTSIGMEILSEFNRQQLKGEVYFITLSKIQSGESQPPLPEDNRTFRPLLSSVGFPQTIAKVGQYVCGKYLLVNSLDNAVLAGKLHKWNSVTLDGDKVLKSGVMTGGYNQSGLGPLELFRWKSNSDKMLDEEKRKKDNIESKLSTTAATVQELVKKKESLDTKKSRCRLQREELTSKIKILLDKEKYIEMSLKCLVKQEDSLKKSQIELKCREKAIQKLRSGEPVTCKTMKEAESMRKRLKDLAAQRASILNEINELESAVGKAQQIKQRLNENIQDEKNKQCDRLSHTQRESLYENLDSTIQDFEVRLQNKQEQISVVVATITNLKLKQVSLLEKSSKLGDKKLKIETELVKLAKEMEGLMSIHMSYERKQKELKEKSSKIASVPSEVEKYSATDSKDLYEKLKKIKSKTSDNDGVNQKALEQYEEITTSYKEFSEKMEKLESEKNALYECIEDLEERRGQAAHKCFVTLQEQFQEIFTNIVPAGIAELVLYSDSLEVTSKNMRSAAIQKEFGRQTFQGLKINVNFLKPQLGKMKNLMSLSGGQKAVVALSLILAVQKIEPVPFYLFDEVDQALDSQYREAVSEVIQAMSSEFKLQFVCTTFRKEFLHGADKVYGVSYANKVSTVRPISSADASEFVESESSDQQHINFSQNMSFIL